MARSNDDPDSGSSQFFFLKWLQALVAPGRNTLDGYYSCFGYVVKVVVTCDLTFCTPNLSQFNPNLSQFIPNLHPKSVTT